MQQLSEQSMCMSRFDRRKQQLCWYDDGIFLCTPVRRIAREIQRECKRRKLKCTFNRTSNAMIPHRLYKIRISKSLKAFNKKL